MANLILGRYIPGDSFVHRLDPRSKLLSMLIFIIVVFWANNVLTNLLMFGFTMILVFLSRVKISFFLKGLRPMIGLILFTTLFKFFLHRMAMFYFIYGLSK